MGGIETLLKDMCNRLHFYYLRTDLVWVFKRGVQARMVLLPFWYCY